ncbi:MAG: hypothetical protein VKI83_09990 [Synechococcaceae cyanobacterium]|nr:hypothetical protein [Synechococcaceae cyanobacterium]
MTQFSRSLLLALLGLVGALLLSMPFAQAGSLGSAVVLPYPAAVQKGRIAAEAVLQRAGRETCLRGKLNRALLGLSASCEAAGERNALCTLADKAVVVTPMSLAFMDETSQRLLELSAPAVAAPVQR